MEVLPFHDLFRAKRIPYRTMVVDPHSFDTDPDPGVLMTKNLNKFFFYQKLQFTYPWASIKDVQVTKSLQLSKRTLWVIFALLDPDRDPLTQLNPDPVGIRIRTNLYRTYRTNILLLCSRKCGKELVASWTLW
jgi:hypothetical protein